jgi:hypothetical protein
MSAGPDDHVPYDHVPYDHVPYDHVGVQLRAIAAARPVLARR